MSEYVLNFAGHKVLSQQHGTCYECRREVVKLLLDTPSGRDWRLADQLITGLRVHSCPPQAARAAA